MFVIVNLKDYKKACEYEFGTVFDADKYAIEYLELQDYSVLNVSTWKQLHKIEGGTNNVAIGN
jgi:hypothetical protein